MGKVQVIVVLKETLVCAVARAGVAGLRPPWGLNRRRLPFIFAFSRIPPRP
jgi:hypothetical protein